jgi:hypothetical protein
MSPRRNRQGNERVKIIRAELARIDKQLKPVIQKVVNVQRLNSSSVSLKFSAGMPIL